jgi:hypothetical protein
MTDWHLAQINIGRTVAPLDDPAMAGFIAALDPVNALADASLGFVWRLQDDSGHATNIRVFDDPRMIINMSVWESLAALRAFTYRSHHVGVLTRRKQWFEKLDRPHLALWWTAAGGRPTAAEGLARLDHLHRNGPGEFAFTFNKPPVPPAR